MTIGIVLSASRGNAKVLINEEIIKIGFNRKFEVIVGDHIEIENDLIVKIIDRKNVFKRSYFGKTKEIAANLDLLLIVTATKELFNTLFIDRVACICEIYNIPTSLIVNKIDQQGDEENLICEYETVFTDHFRTNAKDINSLSEVVSFINNPKYQQIALTGMSGVGKSTILNQLIPSADARTSNVSHKTGQGVQTTTMARAYQYNDKLLIDLPGIQSFGITELLAKEVRFGFPEIVEIGNSCKYSDCYHNLEDHCAVKKALEENKISRNRYNNYLHILKECKSYVRY